MTETERQKARAELIHGISIDRMIADLSGKTYGQLVQTHLRKLSAQLPAGIAASVALCTRDERAASKAIIDNYNAKGYDATFWASDAGEVLSSVSCDLNDAIFPDTADDAGVFNLFQLITQNFALMAREQKGFNDFILGTPSQKHVGSVITGIGGLVLFLAMLGFGVSSTTPMPDYAHVLIDDAKRVYIAPPCVTDDSRLSLVTARQAYDLNYKPEEHCRDEGGFVSDGRSLTGMFLQKIGLLRSLPERWNPDGTWNW